MRKKGFLLGSIFVLVLGALTGCSGNSQGASGEQLSGTLTVVGSTAMQPLVDEAGKMFTASNPGVQVNVQGGGSGAGLSAVMNDTADIGNSDVYAEEKEKVDSKQVIDHKVFVVGIAPVVNPGTGVDNVTHQQLIGIFTGKIKNWKELGGKDQAVVLVNRPASSGTRATFAKYGLLGHEEFRGEGGIEEESSGTVRKIVSETPGAVGYLAFSYVDDSVKALKIDNVEPTNENVYTNNWKIWAYEHMYTNKNNKNKQLEEAFINYIKSGEVQNGLVKKLGYIPISEMKVERDVDGNLVK